MKAFRFTVQMPPALLWAAATLLAAPAAAVAERETWNVRGPEHAGGAGDGDRSLFLNMPGQSGNAGDPHYKDLFPRWLSGNFARLVYTRAAVDESAENIIRLTPAK